MPGGAEANPKRLVVGSRARLASRPGVSRRSHFSNQNRFPLGSHGASDRTCKARSARSGEGSTNPRPCPDTGLRHEIKVARADSNEPIALGPTRSDNVLTARRRCIFRLIDR